MTDPIQTLREQSWRRPLTDAERAAMRAWLEAHPAARAEWDADATLSRALGRLPDSPVPTNFTARVLQAVERETAVRHPASRWSWRFLLPRTAIAMLVIAAAGFGWREYNASQRVALARSVAAVSDVTSLPSPEILQDFEAIRQLPTNPRPDLELLALLQ